MRADVTVDDRFVRFGSKSYAINKITSVDVRSETTPGETSAAVPLYLLGGAIILGSLVAGGGVFGLMIGGVAIFAGWRSKAVDPVTTYRLFLVTNAGEAEAMETTDRKDMARLREAIEDAMARSN